MGLGAFLILVVLIQKGKGGGLAGAFGGVGGSSPFGSKSGTFFTRLTIIVAGIWVLFIVLSVWAAKSDSSERSPDSEDYKPTASRSRRGGWRAASAGGRRAREPPARDREGRWRALQHDRLRRGPPPE